MGNRNGHTDIVNKLMATKGEREGGEGQERGKGLIEVWTITYKINKIQGYIVKYRECSQYFKIITMKGVCASLVAQTVKNLPAVQDTWVWSLGWEDSLEKGMAIHASILAWRIPWTEEPCRLQSIGHKQLDRTEQLTLSLFTYVYIYKYTPSH